MVCPIYVCLVVYWFKTGSQLTRSCEKGDEFHIEIHWFPAHIAHITLPIVPRNGPRDGEYLHGMQSVFQLRMGCVAACVLRYRCYPLELQNVGPARSSNSDPLGRRWTGIDTAGLGENDRRGIRLGCWTSRGLKDALRARVHPICAALTGIGPGIWFFCIIFVHPPRSVPVRAKNVTSLTTIRRSRMVINDVEVYDGWIIYLQRNMLCRNVLQIETVGYLGASLFGVCNSMIDHKALMPSLGNISSALYQQFSALYLISIVLFWKLWTCQLGWMLNLFINFDGAGCCADLAAVCSRSSSSSWPQCVCRAELTVWLSGVTRCVGMLPLRWIMPSPLGAVACWLCHQCRLSHSASRNASCQRESAVQIVGNVERSGAMQISPPV